MANLRVAENHPALERQLLATIRCTRPFQWLVGKCVELHHHYSTPNCSQLGVFTSSSRRTRGVHAHSACARGWSEPAPVVAGSTLFCPLFSGNLRQLFRRSTRTSSCVTTTCACVGFLSSPTGLDEQTIRANRGPGTRTASSTCLGAGWTSRVLGRHAADPRTPAFPCLRSSP